MIGRVRGRRSFNELQEHGRRARSGPLTVVFCSDDSLDRPCVAFSVPRALGRAVDRNRVRRQLRPAIAELAAAGALRPGNYLFALRRAPGSREELVTWLTTALTQLHP